MKFRLDPMLEETLVATGFMSILGAFICLCYWALTGLSPWPYVVVAEIFGSVLGIALLVLAAPKRYR